MKEELVHYHILHHLADENSSNGYLDAVEMVNFLLASHPEEEGNKFMNAVCDLQDSMIKVGNGKLAEGMAFPIRITSVEKKYLLSLKRELGKMKQVEMLDLLLKELYNHKDNGKHYSIETLLEQVSLKCNKVEAQRLRQRLIEDRVAKESGFGSGPLIITSLGIDYCESNSYSRPGTSLINLHMGDINNSNIFFNSGKMHHSSINQTTGSNDSELDLLIKRIKAALHEIEDPQQQDDKAGCLEDVVNKAKKGERIPQWQWNSLTQNTANLATLGQLLFTLGQSIGVVPK